MLTRPAVFAPLLALLATAASLWFADRGLPNPDEGAVLTAAARILRGAVFYRDIDAYWTPAPAWLLAGASALFGEHLSVARALAGALYVTTLLALYAAALELLDRARAAVFALSLLAFKFLAWPGFTAYLYSDFAFAFACIATALLLRHPRVGSRAALAAAGACATLAFFSKQNVGIYLGAVALALLALPGSPLGEASRRERARRDDALAFAAGGAALALPALAYFAVRGVLPRMLDSAFLRPFTDYLGTSGIPFSVPLRWWELGALRGNDAIPYFPFRLWHMLMQGQLPGWDHYIAYWNAAEVVFRAAYTALPLVFALALARALGWRARGAQHAPARRRLGACAALGLAVALTAFPRADWFHVASVYPLVLLVAFAVAQPLPRETARPPRLAAAAVAGLLALSTALSAQYFVYLSHRLELARAELWVDPSDAWVEPLVAAISEEVGPGEPFFVYGHEAHYYFLAGRFSPWPFAQLYPGQTGPDAGADLIQALQRDPPALVVAGLESWTGIPLLRDYAPALVDWMRAHFERDRHFFERHPPPVGRRPPGWVVSVLRPREEAPTGVPPPAAAPGGNRERGPAGGSARGHPEARAEG